MTRIVAHRGGALLWPENSRAACRGAASLGVEEIQLDVHATRDGDVVVIHDGTLDRTTVATGPVAAHDAASLRAIALRDGSGETVPMLSDLLPIVTTSGARLRLELKRDREGRAYPDLLRALALLIEDPVIASFAPEDLRAARDALPNAARIWMLGSAYLAMHSPFDAIDDALRDGVAMLAIRWNALPDGFADAVRGAGLALDLFGCHDEASISAALDARADTISTDRPDLAIRLRETRG